MNEEGMAINPITAESAFVNNYCLQQCSDVRPLILFSHEDALKLKDAGIPTSLTSDKESNLISNDRKRPYSEMELQPRKSASDIVKSMMADMKDKNVKTQSSSDNYNSNVTTTMLRRVIRTQTNVKKQTASVCRSLNPDHQCTSHSSTAIKTLQERPKNSLPSILRRKTKNPWIDFSKEHEKTVDDNRHLLDNSENPERNCHPNDSNNDTSNAGCKLRELKPKSNDERSEQDILKKLRQHLCDKDEMPEKIKNNCNGEHQSDASINITETEYTRQQIIMNSSSVTKTALHECSGSGLCGDKKKKQASFYSEIQHQPCNAITKGEALLLEVEKNVQSSGILKLLSLGELESLTTGTLHDDAVKEAHEAEFRKRKKYRNEKIENKRKTPIPILPKPIDGEKYQAFSSRTENITHLQTFPGPNMYIMLQPTVNEPSTICENNKNTENGVDPNAQLCNLVQNNTDLAKSLQYSLRCKGQGLHQQTNTVHTTFKFDFPNVGSLTLKEQLLKGNANHKAPSLNKLFAGNWKLYERLCQTSQKVQQNTMSNQGQHISGIPSQEKYSDIQQNQINKYTPINDKSQCYHHYTTIDDEISENCRQKGNRLNTSVVKNANPETERKNFKNMENLENLRNRISESLLLELRQKLSTECKECEESTSTGTLKNSINDMNGFEEREIKTEPNGFNLVIDSVYSIADDVGDYSFDLRKNKWFLYRERLHFANRFKRTLKMIGIRNYSEFKDERLLMPCFVVLESVKGLDNSFKDHKQCTKRCRLKTVKHLSTKMSKAKIFKRRKSCKEKKENTKPTKIATKKVKEDDMEEGANVLEQTVNNTDDCVNISTAEIIKLMQNVLYVNMFHNLSGSSTSRLPTDIGELIRLFPKVHDDEGNEFCKVMIADESILINAAELDSGNLSAIVNEKLRAKSSEPAASTSQIGCESTISSESSDDSSVILSESSEDDEIWDSEFKAYTCSNNRHVSNDNIEELILEHTYHARSSSPWSDVSVFDGSSAETVPYWSPLVVSESALCKEEYNKVEPHTIKIENLMHLEDTNAKNNKCKSQNGAENQSDEDTISAPEHSEHTQYDEVSVESTLESLKRFKTSFVKLFDEIDRKRKRNKRVRRKTNYRYDESSQSE